MSLTPPSTGGVSPLSPLGLPPQPSRRRWLHGWRAGAIATLAVVTVGVLVLTNFGGDFQRVPRA